jgi:hypothetical protein
MMKSRLTYLIDSGSVPEIRLPEISRLLREPRDKRPEGKVPCTKTQSSQVRVVWPVHGLYY